MHNCVKAYSDPCALLQMPGFVIENGDYTQNPDT